MVRVQNIYYMLSYVFRILDRDDYKKLGSESFNNSLELYSSILSIGISHLIKRGLYKEYRNITEVTSSPRGKLLISETVKKNTLKNKKVVCNADDFSKNCYVNKIIKTVLNYLIRSKKVSNKFSKPLKNLVMYFKSVDSIDLNDIHWNSIEYLKNNQVYKTLLNICYLVVNELLQTENKGKYGLYNYSDDRENYKLFEKFVLKYYQKHYPGLHAKASHIKWNIDNQIMDLLPKMMTDICLINDNKKLIIDTKYYEKKSLSTFHNSKSQHSSNMYQIYSYVKNEDTKKDGTVSGLLLYARTDESVLPDKDYQIDGNLIAVRSIDLNTDFYKIEKSLKNIVLDYL